LGFWKGGGGGGGLPGPEDARICFTFLRTTREFSEIQRSALLIMIICEILLFILICFTFWELKSTMGGIGALSQFYFNLPIIN